MKRSGLSSCQQYPRKPASLCFSGLVAAIVLSMLCGCATKKLYDWDSYNDSMEQIYEKENPAQAELMLGELFQKMENDSVYSDGPRVPPGAYADYGFLLFRRGDTARAVSFFEMEKRAFPESAVFIDKVLNRANKKASSATGKKPMSEDVQP